MFCYFLSGPVGVLNCERVFKLRLPTVADENSEMFSLILDDTVGVLVQILSELEDKTPFCAKLKMTFETTFKSLLDLNSFFKNLNLILK
jgi:hypothetical protein